MFKKIICAFLVFAAVILTFSGCGKQVETAKVDKNTSVSNFAAYRQDIIKIMDKADVKYKLIDIDYGKIPGATTKGKTYLALKITLESKKKEEIAVTFLNEDQIENFVVSIQVNESKLEDCKLNLRDYPYLRDIFNLISEIKVSSIGCNRFMRKTRRGAEDKLNENPDSFYLNKNKYFLRDKTKTWFLQYTIYMQTAASPVVFEETLSYKGNLAPGKAAG